MKLTKREIDRITPPASGEFFRWVLDDHRLPPAVRGASAMIRANTSDVVPSE